MSPVTFLSSPAAVNIDEATVLYQMFEKCICVRVIAINEFSYYLTSASQSIFIEFLSRDCVYVLCVYACVQISCQMYQTIKGNES